jgi:hypothetical protein
MRDLIYADTKPGVSYPGYVNFTREDDGSVTLVVRGDPSSHDGVYVCGYAPRDTGAPGRCTPGDDRCNNYCNMAPGKGPMQPGPLPCIQIREGTITTLRLSAVEFAALVAGLKTPQGTPAFDGGRDTTAAAKGLAAADDAWLAEIVHRDPDMIRDVAAALIYERGK